MRTVVLLRSILFRWRRQVSRAAGKRQRRWRCEGLGLMRRVWMGIERIHADGVCVCALLRLRS